MDVALISQTRAEPTDRSRAGTTTSADGRFDAVMASGDDKALLDRAEASIGARIRAPEGGCSCDALVGDPSSSPNSSRPSTPVPTAPPVAGPSAGPFAWAPPPARQLTDIPPGSVLLLNNTERGDHVHQAVVRNATEMITTNTSGMVEVLSIPWGQVEVLR